MNFTTDMVINISQGLGGITEHAGTSTDGWIGWIITFSIWLILFFLVMTTDEKHWAVGAASFVALIVAIGCLILGLSSEKLIILLIVLTVLGLAGGYVGST